MCALSLTTRFFKKQTLLFVLAALSASLSRAHASQCVADYLTSVIPELHRKYADAKESLRVGAIELDRYKLRKNITKWGPRLRSAEVGRITEHHIPEKHWLSGWIKKLHDQGAELRLLEYEQQSPLSGKWEKSQAWGAYFSYDPVSKIPYIAVSVRSAPDTLAHENDHLERWLNLRDSLVKQGFDLEAAGNASMSILFESAMGLRSAEHTAVTKELQKDSEIQRSVYSGNPIKWLYPSGALPFTELEILTRQLIYPDAEAIKMALTQKSSEAPVLMRSMIRKALLLRLTAYQRAKNASATIEKGLELDSQGQALFMQELQNLTEFFESIMLAEKGRFELAKVYDQAKSLFEAELPSVWESLPVQKRGDFKPRFKAGQ